MLYALHCRGPVLRRRAEAVLTHQHYRSDTVAKVAERMMAREERGLVNLQFAWIFHSFSELDS